jgi:diguanylate cyclase (GGDEF)-like protein
LQKFVNITKAFIRKSDMFFRYKNGDEFAVIVDNIGIEEAKEIGDRLRRSIDMYLFNIDDITVDLTISIGIANSINTDSPKEIRHRAEIALNKAKQTRNTVIVAGE